MVTKIDTDAVLEKMGEVCNTLMQQESYKEMRRMIDTFAADEQAVEQYESFMNLHRTLQQKEEMNAELTQEEINSYEQGERALYDNTVIRQFLFAQREFSQLIHLIDQFVTKSIELDRLPEPGELKNSGCGCGGSCGCGGHH